MSNMQLCADGNVQLCADGRIKFCCPPRICGPCTWPCDCTCRVVFDFETSVGGMHCYARGDVQLTPQCDCATTWAAFIKEWITCEIRYATGGSWFSASLQVGLEWCTAISAWRLTIGATPFDAGTPAVASGPVLTLTGDCSEATGSIS